MSKKKIMVGVAALLVVFTGVAAMSAWEAHVINVTARIENALEVPTEELEFGTVFPQEKLYRYFSVGLSQSFIEQAGCTEVLELGNGGFELPEVTHDKKWEIFSDDDPDLEWTVEWESDVPSSYDGLDRPDPALQELHEGVNGWAPYEGDQYAELDSDWDGPDGGVSGEPALVRIYQEISTVPGATYVLHYAYSPRPDVTDPDENELIVRINGSQVDSHKRAGDGSQTDWTTHSYSFVAGTSSTKIEFAGGGTSDSLGVFLDAVSLEECGRVTSVEYVLRQKPKCWDGNESEPMFGRVTEDEGGKFVCEDQNYTKLPLLCPYLSKTEITEDGEVENDGAPIPAFHGELGDGWTMEDVMENEVEGRLSFTAGDLEDEWEIDLDVPCFEDHCAQEWEHRGWELDSDLNSALFGCDLWLEVTGIDGGTPQ